MVCAHLLATLALSIQCHASVDLNARVLNYLARAGYKADTRSVKAVVSASELFGVSALDLTRIAILESSFNPHKKSKVNSNGTRDVGMFQINDINRHTICNGFNIDTIEGNALCAGKIVSELKKNWGKKDPRWIARFHSKTPVLKHEYYRKFASI